MYILALAERKKNSKRSKEIGEYLFIILLGTLGAFVGKKKTIKLSNHLEKAQHIKYSLSSLKQDNIERLYQERLCQKLQTNECEDMVILKQA